MEKKTYKLYEIPRNSLIKMETFSDIDGKQVKLGDYVVFHHLDGIYSYCTVAGDNDKVVHLSVQLNLAPVNDYYEIVREE